MSSNVDERIVRMQFDNRKFEQNVSASIKTIDKLKKALKLDEAAKGFDELDRAAKRLDLSCITKGIDEVHNNFNFLDVAIMNVFNRITNAAINTGQQIVKALAIDPVTTGFQEYETKMNSIQVIAANTGALNQEAAESANDMAASFQAVVDIWKSGSLGNGQARVQALNALGLDANYVQDNVNKIAYGVVDSFDELKEQMIETGEEGGTTISHIEEVLDDLNHYADKTIYNFTQMTQAIGQFTTAGVDVDTSARSVKGIANLAAYVGAPASDASRSMFQLSQALSTGRVRLQDWMSLEHTAGMGGKVFQEALIKTAEHHGIAVREMIEANGSFRESLKEDWLTTDILSETLAQFSGDFGAEYWAELGYAEDEIKDIINLGTVATEAATKVRTFTQMWDALKEAAQSGWTETWQYIVGGFEDAPKLWTAINNAITGIIDPFNDARNEALKFWYSAKIGGRSTWFNAIESTNFVLDENGEKIAKVDEEGKELKDTYGNIVYETEKVTEYSGILVDLWDSLAQIVEPIGDAFNTVFNERLEKILVLITARVRDFAKSFKDGDKHPLTLYTAFTKLFEIVKSVLKVFGKIAKVFANVVKLIVTIVDSIADLTDEMSETEDGGNAIADVFDSIADVFDKVAGYIQNVTDKFKESEGAMSIVKLAVDSVIGAFKIGAAIIQAVGKVFGHVLEKITPVTEGFENAAVSVVDFIENTIDVDKIVEWIGNAADNIIDFVDNFDTYFSEATDTLASWIKETTGVDISDIWQYLLDNADKIKTTLSDMAGIQFDNLKGMFEDLKSATPAIDNVSSLITSIKKGSETVNEIPTTIEETTAAWKGLKYEGSTKVLESFSKAFGDIGKKIDLSKLDPAKVAELGGAFALLLTALQAKNITDKVSDVAQGFVDIKDKIIGTIDAFTKTFNNFQTYLKSQMILNIAIAIGVLALSLLGLSLIPTDKLAGAVAAMIAMFWGLKFVLDALSKSMMVIKGPTGLIGATLLSLGATFLMIAGSMAILAAIPEDQLGSAAGALYVAISAIMLILKSFNKLTGTDPQIGATAIITIAVAIGIISIAVRKLADTGYSFEEFLPALGVIGSIMAAMTIMIEMFARLPVGKIETSAGAILTVAVAIDILVGGIAALAAIAKVDSEAFYAAVDSMVVISACMGALVLVMALVSGMASGAKLGSFAIMMLAIATSIDIVVGGVAALAAIAQVGNLDAAMKAIASISTIIGGFLVLMALFSNAPGTGFVKMALMLGAITGAISAISGIAVALSVIPADRLMAGIDAIGAIATIIGILVVVAAGAGALMALSGGALSGMAAGIASLALNFLTFAAALALVGAAVFLTAEGLTAFWALLKDIGNNGSEVLDNLANVLATKLPVFGAIVLTYLPQFVDTFFQGLMIIMEKLNVYLPLIFNAVLNLIVVYIPILCAKALELIASVLTVIADALPTIIQALGEIVIALVGGLGIWMEANADRIADAINQFLVGFFTVLVATISELWNSFINSEFVAQCMELLSELGIFFSNLWQTITGWLSNIWNSIKDWWNGMSLFEKLWAGLHLIAPIPMLILDLLKSLAQKVITIISFAVTFVWNKIVEITKEIGMFILNIPTLFIEGRNKIVEAGKDFIQGLIDGIKEKFDKVKETVTDLATKLVNWFRGSDGIDAHSPSKKGIAAGNDFGQGVADGLDESQEAVQESAESLANTIPENFDKDTMNASMESAMDNMTTLMQNKLGESGNSLGESFADSFKDYGLDESIQSQFDSFGNMNFDTDMTANISPVLNFDDLQITGSDPSGMFDMLQNGSLSPETSFDMASITNSDIMASFDYEEPEPYDDSNVIEAIANLSAKMDDIAKGLTGMDVYLDSNALVGELAGPLDAEFGKRATRNARSGR